MPRCTTMEQSPSLRSSGEAQNATTSGRRASRPPSVRSIRDRPRGRDEQHERVVPVGSGGCAREDALGQQLDQLAARRRAARRSGPSRSPRSLPTRAGDVEHPAREIPRQVGEHGLLRARVVERAASGVERHAPAPLVLLEARRPGPAPICPVRVQCVPPQGDRSKPSMSMTRTSWSTFGARRSGSFASSSAWGKSCRTATSSGDDRVDEVLGAHEQSRSASAPSTSIVHAVAPRRDDTVSARATSTSARESACCAVCCAM